MTSDQEHPEFSVLVTCHYEEQSIEEFHARLSKAMESLERSYELIFVNDGSTDRTFQILNEMFQRDSNVSALIDFFKNSGQQAALTAAVCEAKGKAIIFMDSDLQLMPEEIPLLVREFDRGYDIVSGYRRDRKDSLFRVLPSKIANIIMRRASQSSFRDFGCTFKIINVRLVKGLEFGPHHLYNNVEIAAKAGKCSEIPVSHVPRKYGKSGWTFSKLWKYNLDNLVVMSERPFQILASVSLLLALLFVIRILVDTLTPFKILPSVSLGLLLNAIVISLFINVGILCILGEFVVRTFIASRNSPKYIIKETLRRHH